MFYQVRRDKLGTIATGVALPRALHMHKNLVKAFMYCVYKRTRVIIILVIIVIVIINLFRNYSQTSHLPPILSLREDNSFTLEASNVHYDTKNSSVTTSAGHSRARSRDSVVVDHVKFQPLPPSVIDGIRTFLFFIGVARSGHSIVAALLDSHPHVVISNELDIFNRVLNDWKLNRSSLFNKIWYASHNDVITSDASINLHSSSKGYSLAIEGLYQGTYKSHIDVIGDKKGGYVIRAFLANPKLFERRLNRLHDLTNLPIKVLHVIRNPYDNIATITMYRHFKFELSKVAKMKNSNKTLNASYELVDTVIDYYFRLYQASEVIKRQYNLDVMDVHGIDLITNPKATISEMCEFIRVTCSQDYLNIVSRKMFGSESKTRYKLTWTNVQISKIKKNILKFSSLRRYLNFNS